jgi:hypothetical protein
MLKSKPVGQVAEREKMPFEVTPFMLYLTRQVNTNSANTNSNNGAISANSNAVTNDNAPAAQPQK